MKKNIQNQGFTIVEIAIVMVIFGLLMSMFGTALVAYQKRQKYDETKKRLAIIQVALDEFLEKNQRYPCTGGRADEPGDAMFGQERTRALAGGAQSCQGSIPNGGRRYDPDATPALVGHLGGVANNLWVRYGSVPVRSLNLPDEYILDAWGNRFTYLVSIRLASDDYTYRSGAGAINVVDTGNNDVIDQANQVFSTGCAAPGCRNFAEYVVISHGEDGSGAAVLSQADLTNPAIPCDVTQTQSENCIHTAARPNVIVSDVISDGDYDDIVVFKSGTSFNEILPSGAVIGYDRAFAQSLTGLPGEAGTPAYTTSAASLPCPGGWAPFEDGRGRMIMGATEPGTPAQRRSREGTSGGSVDITGSGSVINYDNLGDVGGNNNASVRRGVPTYVTTLFCEKQ